MTEPSGVHEFTAPGLSTYAAGESFELTSGGIVASAAWTYGDTNAAGEMGLCMYAGEPIDPALAYGPYSCPTSSFAISTNYVDPLGEQPLSAQVWTLFLRPGQWSVGGYYTAAGNTSDNAIVNARFSL